MSDFVESLSPEELIQVRATIAVHDLIVLKFQLIDSAVRLYGFRQAMGMIPAFTTVEITLLDALLDHSNMEALADTLPKPPISKRDKVGWVWRRTKASLKVAITGLGVMALATVGVTVGGGAYWAMTTIPDLPSTVTRKDAETSKAEEFLQVRQALFQDLGINDMTNFTDKVVINQEDIQKLMDEVEKLKADANSVFNLVDSDYKIVIEGQIQLSKYEIDLNLLGNELEALYGQNQVLEEAQSEEEREAVGTFVGVLRSVGKALRREKTPDDVQAEINVLEKKFGEVFKKYKAAGGSDPFLNKERANELFDASIDVLRESLEIDEAELKRLRDFWNENGTPGKMKLFQEGPLREAFMKQLRVRVFEHLLDPNNVNVVKDGKSYARDVKLAVNNIVPNVFDKCIKHGNNNPKQCSDLEGTIELVRNVFDGEFRSNYTAHSLVTIDDKLLVAQDLAIKQRRNIRKLEEIQQVRVILRTIEEVIPVVYPTYTPAALPFLAMCNAELDALLFKWVIYLGEWKQSAFILPSVIAGAAIAFGSSLLLLSSIDITPIVSDQIVPLDSNDDFGFNTTLEIPYALEKKNPEGEDDYKLLRGEGKKKTVTMKDIISAFITVDEVGKMVKASQADKRAKKMLDIFLFACYMIYSDPRTYDYRGNRLIWSTFSLWWNEEKDEVEFYGDNPYIGEESQTTVRKAFHFRNILFMMFGVHADKGISEMLNYYRFLTSSESIYRFYTTVVQKSFDTRFIEEVEWNQNYESVEGIPTASPLVQVIQQLITYTKPSEVVPGDVFYEWIDTRMVKFEFRSVARRANKLLATVFHTKESVQIMSPSSVLQASQLLAKSFEDQRNFDFLTPEFEKGAKHLLVLADLVYLDMKVAPLNLLGE
jgi:hypothetical protein